MYSPSVDIFLQPAPCDRTSLQNWAFLHDLCRVVCEWQLSYAHEAVWFAFSAEDAIMPICYASRASCFLEMTPLRQTSRPAL